MNTKAKKKSFEIRMENMQKGTAAHSHSAFIEVRTETIHLFYTINNRVEKETREERKKTKTRYTDIVSQNKWSQMRMNGHDHFCIFYTNKIRVLTMLFNSYMYLYMYINVCIYIMVWSHCLSCIYLFIFFSLCYAFFRFVSFIFDQREFRLYFNILCTCFVYGMLEYFFFSCHIFSG